MITDTRKSPYAPLKPVAVSGVEIRDGFWAPRLKRNREVTIPGQYRRIEETGRLNNFRRAAGERGLSFQGIFFNDSDVYKWAEAASWALSCEFDPRLAHILNMVVRTISSAQQPDGYLNTYFMFERKRQRWANLRDMHELYCAGHLIQAAVAYDRTAKIREGLCEDFLGTAARLASHINSVFARRRGTSGHEEIEMALVELFRTTGDGRHLKLARKFIQARGSGLAGGDEYHQDHKPFLKQDAAVGHAVRAAYLYAGAADVMLETGDAAYRAALERIWENAATRRMYVTGALGARYEGEAFGKDYELPLERAYAETCAAIGGVMWNWRQLLAKGEARYADVMEQALYNSVLSGISLDGRTYFYQNPLADGGSHRREPWFGCACCPPNVSRLLASLPGYFYSVSAEGVWVHLYASGSAVFGVPGRGDIALRQETEYPWSGEIEMEIASGAGDFTVFLRVPGWCSAGGSIKVNGRIFKGRSAPGTYAAIRRRWKTGDCISLSLPMAVRRLAGHPHMTETDGRRAFARGPLVYCVEGVDHPGLDIRDLVLPSRARISCHHRPALLGGVTELRAGAKCRPPGPDWLNSLYRAEPPSRGRRGRKSAEERGVALRAVPYFAWANRAPGRMQVWLKTD